ncbi:MAG: MFS transporter [Syntrophorhabdus sp.]|nr:MFS transporter [Syntrophorhabdus sp.]
MTPPSERLFNRNFTVMIGGQCVALLGSALYSVVLILYLKQMTGSATVLGIVELLAFLPWVVMGPLAGTFVDRANRRSVILWSYFVRSALMLALFFVTVNGAAGLTTLGPFPVAVYAVFVVTACMGIIDSVFNAALNSIIPVVLPKEKVQKGNSLFQGAGGVLAMAGNALGGIFFTVLGGALAFLVNGVSYLCAALWTGFMSLTDARPGKKTSFSCAEFAAETKEGFRFIWGNRGLRDQTIVYTLSNLFFPMVMLALPFLVEDVMRLKGSYYGYLMSMLTLSSIIAYFVFGALKTSNRQNYAVICVLFFIEAAIFLFISFARNTVIVFALFSILSGCMAISRLINTSLKQKVIPDKLRGRVFGTLDSINGALAPLSFAVGGVVIDLLNKNLFILFFVIFAVYTVLAVVFVLSRSIRHFYLDSDAGVDH